MEPPKTGGFGQRAQLTHTILSEEKFGNHGGSSDIVVAIFERRSARRAAKEMLFVAQ